LTCSRFVLYRSFVRIQEVFMTRERNMTAPSARKCGPRQRLIEMEVRKVLATCDETASRRLHQRHLIARLWRGRTRICTGNSKPLGARRNHRGDQVGTVLGY
jgi:hypothetical protein